MWSRFVCISLITIFLSSCYQKSFPVSSSPITHETWTKILQAHVSDNGLVDYQGLKRDSVNFQQYLSLLSQHHPNNNWTQNQQLAYWINAYNAFTIRLILDYYPIKSIKHIKKFELPFVNSIWNKKFIIIESQVYSLNDIEHNILRKQFNEPRIHFAINCASISCPNLSKEAFESNHIDSQLNKAAIRFINDPTKNRISGETIYLSKIFKWFRGDFTRKTGFIKFINLYLKKPVSNDISIKYLKYNWFLNEQI